MATCRRGVLLRRARRAAGAEGWDTRCRQTGCRCHSAPIHYRDRASQQDRGREHPPPRRPRPACPTRNHPRRRPRVSSRAIRSQRISSECAFSLTCTKPYAFWRTCSRPSTRTDSGCASRMDSFDAPAPEALAREHVRDRLPAATPRARSTHCPFLCGAARAGDHDAAALDTAQCAPGRIFSGNVSRSGSEGRTCEVQVPSEAQEHEAAMPKPCDLAHARG